MSQKCLPNMHKLVISSHSNMTFLQYSPSVDSTVNLIPKLRTWTPVILLSPLWPHIQPTPRPVTFTAISSQIRTLLSRSILKILSLCLWHLLLIRSLLSEQHSLALSYPSLIAFEILLCILEPPDGFVFIYPT